MRGWLGRQFAGGQNSFPLDLDDIDQFLQIVAKLTEVGVHGDLTGSGHPNRALLQDTRTDLGEARARQCLPAHLLRCLGAATRVILSVLAPRN